MMQSVPDLFLSMGDCNNTFAYCKNSPLVNRDDNGTASFSQFKDEDADMSNDFFEPVGGYYAGLSSSFSYINADFYYPGINASYIAYKNAIKYEALYLNSIYNINNFATTEEDLGATTYYHVTSKEGATQIISSYKIVATEMGNGYVHVLDHIPSLKEARLLGSRSYESIVAFEKETDMFLKDTTCIVKGAWYYSIPGSISIDNPREVKFR